MRQLTIVLMLPLLLVGCSDDGASLPSITVAPTQCVTTPVPEGRLVHITVDDTVGGFGGLGSQASGGLTPGTLRIELEADAENATRSSIRVQLNGADVASISGVAAGDTCGIDVEVGLGTYHVLDEYGHDVDFEVVTGE